MNSTDREWLDERFGELNRRLNAVHDDVLVLKTQRDTAVKVMYLIAGIISLTISLIVSIFRR